MAEAIAEGARSCGAEVSLTDVTSADDGILDGDVILFGCPAMGAEHWRNRSSGVLFLAGRKIVRKENRAVRRIRLGRR